MMSILRLRVQSWHTVSLVALVVWWTAPAAAWGQTIEWDSTTGMPQILGAREPRFPKTLFEWTLAEPVAEEEPAEEGYLVTDRPHIAEASSLVGYGVVQIEFGYTFTQDGHAVSPLFGGGPGKETVQTHSVPETLIRAGMFADWFEFRIAGNFLLEDTQNPDGSHTRQSGATDLYLGAKLALTEQRGVLPEVALFPQMLVPVGSPGFTDGQVLPGFNLAYSWKLNDWLELECNTQLNRRRDDSGHSYTEFLQVVNAEFEITEQIGGFTEWVCFVPNGAVTAGTEQYIHGGFVFLLTKNLQYDVHAAVGLNRRADDFFAGTGLSARF